VRGLPFLFGNDGCRIVVDSSARVLWASLGGGVLDSPASCLGIVDGRLTGRTRHSDRLLRTLIADVEQSKAPLQQLVSSAANEPAELLVTATNCSSGASNLFAITIRDLHRELSAMPDLTRLYGLTPTEQQITRMMIQGLCVNSIAQQLHNSVLTVRTHIKRAYVKLNVGTKEQLFAMMLKLMVD
jgi:DNA-binding CsgD family transcriptional regulator